MKKRFKIETKVQLVEFDSYLFRTIVTAMTVTIVLK